MSNKIPILQVNTLDNKGGAAKSAFRLNAALNQTKEFKSSMAVGLKLSDDETVSPLGYKVLRRLAKGRDNVYSLLMPSFYSLTSLKPWPSSSIVHFHNMHSGFFNILSIKKIIKKKPVIWTLHDPWIIFESGIVPEYNQIFTTQRVSRLMRMVKQNQMPKLINNVTFTAPSLWLKEKVLVVYPKADVRHIPNFVDTSVFKPTDKKLARKTLKLDQDKFIIMLVADSGEDNATKGADALDRIIESNKDVMKLVIGKGANYVTDEAQLALYYSAADLFVFPTRAENFPLVTLEAMACGTPVVAYAVGGIPEQIEHMVDGCLVEQGDEVDLAKYVAELALNPALVKKLSENATKKVNKRYNEGVIIKQFIDLYKEVNG